MIVDVEQREVIAQDVMSVPVVCVDEKTSVLDAGNMMIGQQVRHLVVVSGERCIGVLADRVLLDAWYRGPAALRATPVRDLVANRTSCVLPAAPLRQVARVMNVDQVDAVPVVDSTGKLLGLITAGDVVHAVAAHGLAVPAVAVES